jgi:hypothetical protein
MSGDRLLSPHELQMTGPQARAVAVAYAEFARTGADPGHFTVIVTPRPSTIEVIFLPELTPGRTIRGQGATPDERSPQYSISRDGATLLRTTYGR